MKKITIDLFEKDKVSKEIYEAKRAKYISEYRELNTGLFNYGYTNRPDVGEAKWNEMYPRGYDEWAGDQRHLNAYGEQILIDKINEIVDYINKQKRKKEENKKPTQEE